MTDVWNLRAHPLRKSCPPNQKMAAKCVWTKMAKSNWAKCGDPLLPGHARIGKPYLANLCFNVLAKLSVVVFVPSCCLLATTREPNAHISGSGPSNTTNVQRENPQRKKRETNLRQETTKKAPSPPGPLPTGPPPSGPPPTLSGPHQNKKLAKFGQIKMAKCGQLTLVKCGIGPTSVW